jgi:CheY-like chemotaxis protein
MVLNRQDINMTDRELEATNEGKKELTPETILSTSEVAALFQISPVTVEMWVRNKTLLANKTADGEDRYKYSEITRYAEKHNISVDGDISLITKVLIVDDDSFVTDFLKDFLESREIVYDVQRTGISFMADKLVNMFHPHVVILDLRMPGMNGIELCSTFSTQIENGLRVIGVSGHWSDSEKELFLLAGGECCLDKPLDIREFAKVLEKNREYGEGYNLHVEI